MRMHLIAAALSVAAAGPRAAAADPPDVSSALAAIKAVGREGVGNEAAAAGWKQVVAAGGSALLPTLAAFDGAGPTAANWLRTAVDAIVEGEKKAGRELPAEELREFIRDTKQNPAARRIAYELYAKLDPRAERMLVKMIDDPSLELRRDAIIARRTVIQALGGSPEQRKNELKVLFDAARELDQVQELAGELEKLGAKPDLIARLGFVTRWHIAGPFDGPDGGFATPHPPEKGVDLKATYTGKGGATVTWKPVAGVAPKEHFALVNLNDAVGKAKDAVAYAYAEIESPAEAAVDLRAACPTSVRLFLNGKEVFARDEYHHGNRFDQHAGVGRLKAGRNEILVKVCQNNQTEPWAQVWEFEIRVCDPLGGPVPFKLVSPTAAETPPPAPPAKEEK
jgi:hypothetical protein